MILQNRNRFAESSFEESKSNRFEDFPLDSAAQRAVQGGFSTTPVSSKEGPLWTGDNFLLPARSTGSTGGISRASAARPPLWRRAGVGTGWPTSQPARSTGSTGGISRASAAPARRCGAGQAGVGTGWPTSQPARSTASTVRVRVLVWGASLLSVAVSSHHPVVKTAIVEGRKQTFSPQGWQNLKLSKNTAFLAVQTQFR